MRRRGFTLVELLVVVSIISVLSIIGMTLFGGAQKSARDAKRKADISAISTALQAYYYRNNQFPDVNPTAQGVGGWEVSYMNGFLSVLIPGFIPQTINDPINKLDVSFSFFGPRAGSYYYAYYRYTNPSYYGCSSDGNIVVIAIRSLEKGVTSQTPKAHCGIDPAGGCPGGGIPNVCRDWSTEFDYSMLFQE